MKAIAPRRPSGMHRPLAAGVAVLLAGGLGVSGAFGQNFSNNIKYSGGGGPALNGKRFEIEAGAGQRVGGNLFHSFSDFSLAKDHAAVFKTPGGVDNILARVVGGGVSEIDGTLRTELEAGGGLSGANLFLINPGGIVFGPNAKLEVGGAFTATTADHVKLSDGGRFDARNPAADVLTTAPVSAFGFVTASPAAVSFQGSQLEVGAGKGLQVVGGALTLEGASLQAPAGKLTLHSQATLGEVPVEPSAMPGAGDLAGLGRVHLKGGSVASIDGDGGGRLVIRGGQLVMEGGSAVTSRNGAMVAGAAKGGDIEVSVAGAAELLGGGEISTSAIGTGAGGSLKLSAGSLRIDGSAAPESLTGISARTEFTGLGGGGGGDIEVSVAGAAELLGGGEISAGTFGTGAGGGLKLSAGTLRIDGSAAPESFTGIVAQTQFTGLGGGKAGDMELVIGGVAELWGGGEISTSTIGTGAGGSLKLSAGSLRIDGSAAPENVTGIGAQTQFTGPGGGKAGDMELVIGGVAELLGGGEVSTSTFGTGAGGGLKLSAGTLRIDGSAAPERFTGIRAETEFTDFGAGKGGDMELVIGGAAELLGGGVILAGTFGRGAGGSLKLRALTLRIDGSAAPENFTGIAAGTQFTGRGAGKGGDVELVIGGAAEVLGGGEISTSTFGTGAGGSLMLRAGTLRIDGSAALESFTGIGAQTLFAGLGGGKAGDMELVIGGAAEVLGGGVISAGTSGTGAGGSLKLSAGTLRIDGSAAPENVTGIDVRTEFTGLGGGKAGNMELVIGGAAELLGGGEISAGTFGTGAGGSLKLSAGTLRIDGSAAPESFTGIAAGTQFTGRGAGKGGDVELVIGGAAEVLGGGEISASTFGTGAGGSLKLSAGTLRIDGSAAPESFTGINVAAAFAGLGGGKAGDMELVIGGTAEVLGGGLISASTSGAGVGGRVELKAGFLMIDGMGASAGVKTGVFAVSTSSASGKGGTVSIEACGLELLGGGQIAAEAFGSGDAGDVKLRICGSVVVCGRSAISSASELSRAGRVELEARGPVSLWESSISVRALAGDAGDVVVRTPGRLSLEESEITAVAGQDGGNVTIGAGFLRLAGRSLISANAVNGDGGRITLEIPALGVFGDARDFVVASPFIEQSPESRISASSTFGVAGTLLIDAPFVDLAGSLESLEGALFDASTQLRDQCARKLQQDFSSYLRLGRGGQAEQSEEYGTSF